jgi:hypothetical protein
MNEMNVGRRRVMLPGKDWSTVRKTYPNTTLSNPDLTQTGLGSNMCLLRARQKTGHLYCGTASTGKNI